MATLTENEEEVSASNAIPTEADGGAPQVITETQVEDTTEKPEVVEEEQTGDFNEFLAVKDEPKAEESKPDTVKPKAGETTTTTEQQVQTAPVKETLAQQAERKSRDYAGIPETIKPSFERMSNEAFNTLKPLFIQAQKDKADLTVAQERLAKIPTDGGLPPSYYEHPAAYVLSPEYSQAATNAQTAAIVLEHWKGQLNAVRSGAKEYEMLGINPQTKQLVITGKIPVQEGTQTELESLFFNSNQQANQFQQKLSEISAIHKTKFEGAAQALKQYEDSTFKLFADLNNPMAPQIKDAMNRLHPAFRDNPLASLTAKSIVALTALAQKYQALQKQIAGGGGKTATNGKTNLTNKQKLAGPTASGTSVEAPPKGDEVTMDDFEAVKNS